MYLHNWNNIDKNKLKFLGCQGQNVETKAVAKAWAIKTKAKDTIFVLEGPRSLGLYSRTSTSLHKTTAWLILLFLLTTEKGRRVPIVMPWLKKNKT